MKLRILARVRVYDRDLEPNDLVDVLPAKKARELIDLGAADKTAEAVAYLEGLGATLITLEPTADEPAAPEEPPPPAA
jgi:hypothetical protein